MFYLVKMYSPSRLNVANCGLLFGHFKLRLHIPPKQFFFLFDWPCNVKILVRFG